MQGSGPAPLRGWNRTWVHKCVVALRPSLRIPPKRINSATVARTSDSGSARSQRGNWVLPDGCACTSPPVPRRSSPTSHPVTERERMCKKCPKKEDRGGRRGGGACTQAPPTMHAWGSWACHDQAEKREAIQVCRSDHDREHDRGRDRLSDDRYKSLLQYSILNLIENLMCHNKKNVN